MIVNAQRTIYGMDLALCQLTGKDYKYLPNTTLNEKFGLTSIANTTSERYPTLKYFTIGIGGNGLFSKIESGYTYNTHNPVDAGLFTHIPFIMRDIDNDLSVEERSRYRMRVVETFNGKTYASYYLMMISSINTKDYFYHVKKINGTNVLNVFDTNVDSILSPSPVDKSEYIGIDKQAEYVAKIAKVEFALYNQDVRELNEVLKIRDIEDTKIKEIGICTGIDVPNDGYTEAFGVQIAFHLMADIELSMYMNTSKAILRSIEIGGNEAIIYA